MLSLRCKFAVGARAMRSDCSKLRGGSGAVESSLLADRQLTFSVEVITETETADSVSSGGGGGRRKRGRKGSKVGFSPSLFSIDDDSFGRGARWRGSRREKNVGKYGIGCQMAKVCLEGKGRVALKRLEMEGDHNTM